MIMSSDLFSRRKGQAKTVRIYTRYHGYPPPPFPLQLLAIDAREAQAYFYFNGDTINYVVHRDSIVGH